MFKNFGKTTTKKTGSKGIKIRVKHMKTNVTRFVCLCLLAQVLCYPISASEVKIADAKATTLDASNFISLEVVGNKNIRRISEVSLKRYRDVLAKQSSSESEINREILESLGVDTAAIPPEEIDYLMSQAADITVSESYVQVDQNGNMVELSEAECMQKVADEQLRRAELTQERGPGIVSYSAKSNDGRNDIISTDGYMRIQTTAYYVHPATSPDSTPEWPGEKGWYYVGGLFTWLIEPDYRMTDAMSLYASDCTWSQDEDDYYANLTYGETYTPSSGEQTVNGRVLTNKEAVLQPDGVYFTFNLPNDVGGYRYDDFSIFIRGKCRVSDYTNPRAFNVFSRYEHVYSTMNIQPSFSWSSSAPFGVSADIKFSWVNDSTTYTSLCYVSYDPERNFYK